MNVYDFDKTIYDGDSTVDFFKFSIKRHPSICLGLPFTSVCFVLMLLRLMGKTRCKQFFYRFLKRIPDIDSETEIFWDINTSKIKGWYKKRQKADDLIISASPEFLLEPVCKKLGVALMASRVDRHTGKYSGVNCHGSEKVERYRAVFGDKIIEEFYSDSYSDDPLAQIAVKSFLVDGDKISGWRK